MSSLSEQRCFNHGTREAVARCTDCRNYFCRECITDHDKKIICTACLESLEIADTKTSVRHTFTKPVLSLAGCIALFFLFYLFGETMLALPDTFHDGPIWSPDDLVDGP